MSARIKNEPALKEGALLQLDKNVLLSKKSKKYWISAHIHRTASRAKETVTG